ncbi:MAG: UDP-3-O-acyl-N-acetylglucosamine deacetylase [Chlamydiota bacterium]|nr:UDP-3-O-acyl-N-acetylglucosamine deacetylase [Chlamydiota bacterium]
MEQRTVASAFSLKGRAIFSDRESAFTLMPGNQGIRFLHPSGQKIIAHAEEVVATPRSTILGSGEWRLQMVEHLLSACYGMGIDHADILVEGNELPMLDGSAWPIVQEIMRVGTESVGVTAEPHTLTRPVILKEGEKRLMALPSDHFHVTYILSDHRSSLLQQAVTFDGDPKTYIRQVAPSRTYAIYEEILPLLKGESLSESSLSHGMVIEGDRVLNQGGMRSASEMAHHKVLDILGDLSLTGERFKAHIVGVMSGHAMNCQMAKALSTHFNKEMP